MGPSARGDCLFLHASLFTVAVIGTLVLCLHAALAHRGARGQELHYVRRLALALAIMLLGQVTMIPLLCTVGVMRTLDIWHVSIFIVMALAYSSLRVLVCGPADKKAS